METRKRKLRPPSDDTSPPFRNRANRKNSGKFSAGNGPPGRRISPSRNTERSSPRDDDAKIDVGDQFPATSRRPDRKLSKWNSPTTTTTFIYGRHQTYIRHAELASIVVYRNKSRDVYRGDEMSTGRHVEATKSATTLLTSSSSLAPVVDTSSATAMTSATMTAENLSNAHHVTTSFHNQQPETADESLSSSTFVVISAAVVGIVAFWTIATICVLVVLCRRRCRRRKSRDIVADHVIAKPAKTGNDDCGMDRWTCSTKLLSGNDGASELEENMNLYENVGRRNCHPLASSSSLSHLRWYRGGGGGGGGVVSSGSSLSASGLCSQRRDDRTDTRYSILRGLPGATSCIAEPNYDRSLDSGYETRATTDSVGPREQPPSSRLELAAAESGHRTAPSDEWIPVSPPSYVNHANYAAGKLKPGGTRHSGKRFPRMGCSSSSCTRSPSLHCSGYWTPGCLDEDGDGSGNYGDFRRRHNEAREDRREMMNTRYARLPRSDTTGSRLFNGKTSSVF